MESVFDYLDYREFLKNSIQLRKTKDPKFSHRFLAQKLGLKSSGFILGVIQGKRKLPENLVYKVAEVFDLSDRETEYFDLLVRYIHARSQNQKSRHLSRLMEYKKATGRILDAAQYEYFDKWHYSVIRALVAIEPDPQKLLKLGKSLQPPLSESRMRKGLDLLQKLGLIQKQAGGKFGVTDKIISAGENWTATAIRHLQEEYLHLAISALREMPQEKRNISSVTLGISEKSFRLLEEKLDALRKEALLLASRDENADRIYQLNLQLFPIYDSPEKGGK